MGDGHLNISSTLNPPISSSIPSNTLELDVPIPIRKGTRSCTMDPIAKYLSHTKLSKNHRAFISRISHLFVPRNIQEALGDLNWKLVVIEEMNALRRSGTWEIANFSRE